MVFGSDARLVAALFVLAVNTAACIAFLAVGERDSAELTGTAAGGAFLYLQGLNSEVRTGVDA